MFAFILTCLVLQNAFIVSFSWFTCVQTVIDGFLQCGAFSCNASPNDAIPAALPALPRSEFPITMFFLEARQCHIMWFMLICNALLNGAHFGFRIGIAKVCISHSEFFVEAGQIVGEFPDNALVELLWILFHEWDEIPNLLSVQHHCLCHYLAKMAATLRVAFLWAGTFPIIFYPIHALLMILWLCIIQGGQSPQLSQKAFHVQWKWSWNWFIVFDRMGN